jgi:hypothetical protein
LFKFVRCPTLFVLSLNEVIHKPTKIVSKLTKLVSETTKVVSEPTELLSEPTRFLRKLAWVVPIPARLAGSLKRIIHVPARHRIYAAILNCSDEYLVAFPQILRWTTKMQAIFNGVCRTDANSSFLKFQQCGSPCLSQNAKQYSAQAFTP